MLAMKTGIKLLYPQAAFWEICLPAEALVVSSAARLPSLQRSIQLWSPGLGLRWESRPCKYNISKCVCVAKCSLKMWFEFQEHFLCYFAQEEFVPATTLWQTLHLQVLTTTLTREGFFCPVSKRNETCVADLLLFACLFQCFPLNNCWASCPISIRFDGKRDL